VQDRLLDVALRSRADAIHPGYGFSAECGVCGGCRAAGVVWIGAPAKAIRAMGLKDAAKRLMIGSGVPVTPGYLADDQSEKMLKAEADAIGYPVLIKAVAGGGGRDGPWKNRRRLRRRSPSVGGRLFGDDRDLSKIHRRAAAYRGADLATATAMSCIFLNAIAPAVVATRK
jgi:hypothetical protein